MLKRIAWSADVKRDPEVLHKSSGRPHVGGKKKEKINPRYERAGWIIWGSVSWPWTQGNGEGLGD